MLSVSSYVNRTSAPEKLNKKYKISNFYYKMNKLLFSTDLFLEIFYAYLN